MYEHGSVLGLLSCHNSAMRPLRYNIGVSQLWLPQSSAIFPKLTLQSALLMAILSGICLLGQLTFSPMRMYETARMAACPAVAIHPE